MPALEHTFAATEERVIVGMPGFGGSVADYVQARASQLRALMALMVSAPEAVGEMNDDLRSDLLWLADTLSGEIADALAQIGVNNPTQEVAHA